MELLSKCLIFIIAAFHFFFLSLEMFFWTKPYGLKIFGQTKEKAELTRVLAFNQGLYNGFLAAGLIWSLDGRRDVAIFFLSCVILAGIIGAITVSKKIFFVQAAPALLALSSLFCY